MKDNDKKFTLPMLAAPRTVRVCFRKIGNLQYISHLDLQRTFSRVLVRAGLPLWYTKGFNPHIKMVFGMPLPVGSESECELLDIRVEREMSNEEIMQRLNEELTDELRVLRVYGAERRFADIAFAEYIFTVTSPQIDEAAKEKAEAALADGPFFITKKTKGGEKTVDVTEMIRSAKVSVKGNVLTVKAVLAAGEGKYLSPEAILDILGQKAGLLTGDPIHEQCRILRRRVLLSDGETDFV